MLMPHLSSARLDDPAVIDALLQRGDLRDWQPLRDEIRLNPWGGVAALTLRVCRANPQYGTSRLWVLFIERRRADANPAGDLASIRKGLGFTQQQVGDVLGISQSDVSKMESRSNPRIQTLASYAEAIGCSLRVEFEAL